jgi:putative FmdB family regulatory protein
MKAFDAYKSARIEKEEVLINIPYMTYQCTKCKTIFKVEWNTTYVQGDLPKCPNCGSQETSRLMRTPRETVRDETNKE